MKLTKQQVLNNLDDVKKYIEEIEKGNKRKERAEKGEIHYYIDSYNYISKAIEGGTVFNNYCYYSKNYFLTKEQAVKQQKINQAIADVNKYIEENFDTFEPDWDDEYQKKYYPVYNKKNKKLCIDWHYNCYASEPFILETKEQVEQLNRDIRTELELIFKK